MAFEISSCHRGFVQGDFLFEVSLCLCGEKGFQTQKRRGPLEREASAANLADV